jgi:ABC-2 type transport system permease protein
MSNRGNQFKAAFSIAKYSLLAMLRSPTSIVFSLLFPVIFITVFGSINVGKAPNIKLAVAPGCDTANMIFKAVKAIPNVILLYGQSPSETTDDLKKGQIIAVINITTDNSKAPLPHYTIRLQAASASGQSLGVLETELNAAIGKIDQQVFPENPSVVKLSVTRLPGRVYRSIDFILPGQLGFSLLMAGVYGSSFLLFSLRINLVLKRLRATPVKRRTIIAGEMLSRLLFHVFSFTIMIAFGCIAFKFTLINGVATFMEMLFFSFFALAIFMGTGFIISGVAQNENSIAPIANTVVLPQILLCGLFFPIQNYPHCMQHICNLLPLTFFVDGLRKIAFENTHMWQMPSTLGGLLVWTCIIVPLAVKSFKWE